MCSTRLEPIRQKERKFEEVDWLDKMMLLAAVAGIGVVGGFLVFFNFL